jgi:serine/threonine-protein kinase
MGRWLTWPKKQAGSAAPRSSSNSAQRRVVISYLEPTLNDKDLEPGGVLAETLKSKLESAGHQVMLLTEKSPHKKIEQTLFQCDYFVLLLSIQAALNEVIQKKVRWIQELHDQKDAPFPVIVPVRVKFSRRVNVSYDTKQYLDQIEPLEWDSEAQTTPVSQKLLDLIEQQQRPAIASPASSSSPCISPPPELTTPAIAPWQDPLELPGSPVPINSSFYIGRPPIEAQCQQQIVQPGALIRIKAPAQMGKSSLLNRILDYAQQQGYRVVLLNLDEGDRALLTDADQFLRWFCRSVGQALSIPDQLDERWDLDLLTRWDNCTAYFEEYLLRQVDGPIVLGLDRIDTLFEADFIVNFLTTLRSWYEAARNPSDRQNLWQRLRLVLTYATESFVKMPLAQSPFNVGLPIELPEFSSKQGNELARKYGLQWSSLENSQLMDLVGGHPYLVRLALYHIASQRLTLQQLLAAESLAAIQQGIYSSHVCSRYWHLDQHPELKEAFATLIKAKGQPIRVEAILAFKLESLGLVDRQDVDSHESEVWVRCKLYQQYFSQVLG